MANYKASYPVVATRSTTGTHTGGKAIGKLVSAGVTPAMVEASLYGDDALAESVKAFKNAALTIGVTTIPNDVASMIFGGVTYSTTSTSVTYTDGVAPYVGFGFISAELIDNVEKVAVHWFPKVQFALPTESYATKGDSVSFGTPSLTATAELNGLSDNNNWKEEYFFDNATAAINKLKTLAGISTT